MVSHNDLSKLEPKILKTLARHQPMAFDYLVECVANAGWYSNNVFDRLNLLIAAGKVRRDGDTLTVEGA